MTLYRGIKNKHCGHVEVDCEATLQDLREAAEEAGLFVGEWVSVEDRLPEIFIDVLVYPTPRFSYSDELTASWDGYNWIVTCEDSHSCWDAVMHGVTHWMPLPAPPKKE